MLYYSSNGGHKNRLNKLSQIIYSLVVILGLNSVSGVQYKRYKTSVWTDFRVRVSGQE